MDNPRRNEASSPSSQEVSPRRARDRHVTTWDKQLYHNKEQENQLASTSRKEAIESDPIDQSFRTHFLSKIEEQAQMSCFSLNRLFRSKELALSQSELVELANINRKTPISDVPEKWRMAFAIARGRAILEKVDFVPDKEINTEEQFNNRYKSKINIQKKDGKSKIQVLTNHKCLQDFSTYFYKNSIDITNGIITAEFNYRDRDRDAKRSGEPLSNSEILSNQLLLVLRDQQIDPSKFNLTRVIRKNIYTSETYDTLCCLRNHNKPSVSYGFSKGKDGYYALLGIPNVYGILYLLKQHPSLFGKKEITSIKVVQERFSIDIILHIGEREQANGFETSGQITKH